MKTAFVLAFRWFALIALAVWFGGFTFYSAVVIPVLHDHLGDLGAGDITREVTNYLNGAGAIAMAAWFGLAWAERGTARGFLALARLGLLVIDLAILVGLLYLHPEMDGRLDQGSMRDFYPLHKIYLIASTAQWGVNLALVASALGIWARADARPAPGGPGL